MTKLPTPQSGVLKIAPYVPGKAAVAGGKPSHKLSANESPLGASPKAIEAYRAVAANLHDYPEGSSRALREALAKAHGLEADRIVIGAGSDELLHLIAQVYLGDGDEAVVTEYGFLVYPISTQGAGATPVIAKDSDYRVDVDNVLEAVTDKTKIVWLANPNNPTGTWLSDADVRRLHKGLPTNVLLVIDNAYAEYVTADDFVDGADLVREAENVVMVRTFSKVGLAAARVGWLYGPDQIVDAINRLRGPFNVNSGAQAAAIAAVKDADFSAKLAAHNAKWRDWLTQELSSNSLRVPPSQGNFILVLFPDTPGLTAEDANTALLEAGIVARQMHSYGMPDALRISIGTEEAMRLAADVLKRFAKGAQ